MNATGTARMLLDLANIPDAEEWRPVPGYPDYSASTEGRIVSRRVSREGRLMSETPSTNGYIYHHLANDEGRTPYSAHHIVAITFLGPRPEGMEVRHLDGNPTNNAVRNLQYGTPAENSEDIKRHGRNWALNKTHCPKGHPYDEANTYRAPSGAPRRCRTCMRQQRADQRARRAFQAAGIRMEAAS